MKNYEHKLKYNCFLALIMNVEKLKIKRLSIVDFTERRKMKIKAKIMNAWMPACNLLSKCDYNHYLYQKYFSKLKQNLTVCHAALDVKIKKSMYHFLTPLAQNLLLKKKYLRKWMQFHASYKPTRVCEMFRK